MRERCKEIKVRLSEDELESLNMKVLKSSCNSREKYLRQVINNEIVHEAPKIEYYKFINEINAIGNNLNQLVRQAYKEPIVANKAIDVLSSIKSVMAHLDSEVKGIQTY